MFIEQNAMLISGLILFIAYIFIAIEKIPKVTVALVGAAIALLLGLLDYSKTFSYIDFKVIFLLVSMMIIVNISTKSGMYNWLAIKLLKMVKGKPIPTFITMGIFTAVASAFLDNVTTVILVMPITFVIAKEFKINPVPFLIMEVLCSNIGGTATLIGDPPNIIIGSRAGLGFMDFVRVLTPPVVAIMVVAVTILVLMFRKNLKVEPDRIQAVANIDNSDSIKDKPLMIRSIITLAAVITGFVTHDITHIDAYVSAMAGAGFLLLFEDPQKVFEEVEWKTIFFFVGLFIIIGCLEASGGIKLMAEKLIEITNGDLKIASMIILWGSGILSGIIDNIPYTATMAPLIGELQGTMDIIPLWWSLALGACLGGNFTIIGAAANVLVSETAQAKGYPITFFQFMKYGAIVTIIALCISSAYIYLRFLI